MSEKSTSHTAPSPPRCLAVSWVCPKDLLAAVQSRPVCSCTVQTLCAFPLGTKLESVGRYCGTGRNDQQGRSRLQPWEFEPLMWETFLLVGAVSLHKPMAALCASPKKSRKEKPTPPSDRDRGKAISVAGTLSLTLHRARQSHQEQKNVWCLQLGTGRAWVPCHTLLILLS